jgi:hypothetical protein
MNGNNKCGHHVYGLINMWPNSERSWIPLFRPTSYNKNEMDVTMGFIVYHKRKKGSDGKEDFKRKTSARRWKVIETSRPRNTQNGKYGGGEKKS